MLIHGRPDAVDALFAFCVSLIIAWLLVPLTERAAWRIDAIDQPRERSLHQAPDLIECPNFIAGIEARIPPARAR